MQFRYTLRSHHVKLLLSKRACAENKVCLGTGSGKSSKWYKRWASACLSPRVAHRVSCTNMMKTHRNEFNSRLAVCKSPVSGRLLSPARAA